jgi:hypothetical protein
MSKGHGKVERRLLDILAAETRRFDTAELASQVFQVPHHGTSDAQMVSTRRALRNLRREGLVCGSLNRFVDRRQHWWLAAHGADAALDHRSTKR